MQPPRELPAEVKEEIEQLSRDQVRLGGKTGGLAYLSFNLYIPLLLMMGVRSSWLWVTYALALATSLISFGVARLPRPSTRHAMMVFVLSLICVGTMAAPSGSSNTATPPRCAQESDLSRDAGRQKLRLRCTGLNLWSRWASAVRPILR